MAAGHIIGKKKAPFDRQTRAKPRPFLDHALNRSGPLHEFHPRNTRTDEFRLCRWHRIERIG
jgi:hypothetical protein